MKYRVYFNRFNEAPFVWSVDSGDGTEEFKFADVKIDGGNVTTGVNMCNRGSEDKPCAWLEVDGSLTAEGRCGVIHGFAVEHGVHLAGESVSFPPGISVSQ